MADVYGTKAAGETYTHVYCDQETTPDTFYYAVSGAQLETLLAQAALTIYPVNFQLFAAAKEDFLNAAIEFDSADPVIKVALVNTAIWEYDLESDEDLADVTTNGVIFTAATLDTPTIVDGVADAVDMTFSSVTASKSCTGVLLYVYNVSAASARLVAISDEGVGLPYATLGTNITVVWPEGGIFTLGAE